jgi:hypothetical protein
VRKSTNFVVVTKLDIKRVRKEETLILCETNIFQDLCYPVRIKGMQKKHENQ